MGTNVGIFLVTVVACASCSTTHRVFILTRISNSLPKKLLPFRVLIEVEIDLYLYKNTPNSEVYLSNNIFLAK